jgi:hypothetical protein
MSRIKEYMNDKKARFSTERAKLREMSFKEKRWYIWEYYKLHLLIAIIIVVLAGNLIDVWFINRPKQSYVHIAWMASHISADQLSMLSLVLTESVVTDKTREEIPITPFILTGFDAMFDQAVQQRFMVMLAARELQIFIVESNDYVYDLAMEGFIRPLDPVMLCLAELAPDLHDQLSPNLLWLTLETAGDDEKPDGFYGLPLRGSPLLKGLNIPEGDLYLCMVVFGGNDFKAAQVARAFYE